MWKKIGTDDYDDDDKYQKVRDHCHYTGKFRGAAHSICNLRYKTPKEIPAVFHNGSTYDYHFIINKLAKEFYDQLECLGENTEKYITFSAPISKKLDKGKTITYKLKFIDSLLKFIKVYKICNQGVTALIRQTLFNRNFSRLRRWMQRITYRSSFTPCKN